MRAIKLFITGTDTDVGKTYTSVALLKKFSSLGFSTVAAKPIASGCAYINGELKNEDAILLQQEASVKLDYNIVNPFALKNPIAPHIAAQQENIEINSQKIVTQMQKFFEHPADVYLIEGVGGWAVPLNDRELMADVVKMLNIPVVLVVAIKLGCLNHALLTQAAIEQMQIPIFGWIANCMDKDMKAVNENIFTLQHWLKAPCLGVLPYDGVPEDYLDVKSIIDII